MEEDHGMIVLNNGYSGAHGTTVNVICKSTRNEISPTMPAHPSMNLKGFKCQN